MYLLAVWKKMLTSSVGANWIIEEQNKILGFQDLHFDGTKMAVFRSETFFGCLLRSQWISILSSGSFPNGGACELRWTARSEGTRKKWQGGRLEEFPLRRTIFLKTICITLFKIVQSVFRVKTLAPTQLFDFACAPCRCCYRLEGTKEDIFVNTKNIIEHVTSP